jgi:hypothetical protein
MIFEHLTKNSKNLACSKTASPDIESIYHLRMKKCGVAGKFTGRAESQQIKERQDRDGKKNIKKAKEQPVFWFFFVLRHVMAILLWVSGFIDIWSDA